MLDQLNKSKRLRIQVESSKAMLEVIEYATVSSEEAPALAIEETDARLYEAVAEYQSQRDRVGALSKQITGLETTLMVNKDFREFLVCKREWNDRVYRFSTGSTQR